jgi:UDP-glucose 4-epimerase
MRITITGGFGFMGSLCADFFRKNGHDVSIVSRKIPAELHKWSKDFRIITGDVTGPLEIGGDLVIHCAALNETKNSGPDEFMKVNADGTRNALESAVRNSAGKFIKLSTFHVYGTTEGTITEETVPDPKSLYAKSQLAADNICMDYSKEIDVSVVRFSNVFGPPLHPP